MTTHKMATCQSPSSRFSLTNHKFLYMVVKLESVMYGDDGRMVLPLAASSGHQSSFEQKSDVARDTPLTITTASDMPNEPFGDEGSCSGCAEPERSGSKPAHRRLHLTPPRDFSAEALGPESGSAVPCEFYIYSLW